MKTKTRFLVYTLLSIVLIVSVFFLNEVNFKEELREVVVISNDDVQKAHNKDNIVKASKSIVKKDDESLTKFELKNNLESVEKKAEPVLSASKKSIPINNLTMTPKQINYTYVEEEVIQVIPYETVTLNSLDLEKGKKIIKVAGVVGERKLVSQIKLANGKQVERKTISNTITVAPINEQVLSGSKIDDSFFANETVKMVNEINASRKDSGLSILTRNARLDKAANVRLNEIMTSFSHTRPNGKQFYSVDSDVINGENIAYGMCDATLTHTRFMNSAGHRENILNSTYKSVGVAAIRPEGCPTYWVVLFGNN